MLSQSLISRKNEMDGAEGLADAIKRYEERALEGQKFEGITFGLPEIDQHTMGIHPGELCVFAGTSGGGKSWLSVIVMLSEFERGRKCVLFTLENDVEMTFDRIACVYCKVDYEKWQRGECDEGAIIRVKAFLEKMEASDKKPIIIQPDTTEATGAAMVRRAIIEDADSIIIDQLSHIEPVAGSKSRQRNEIVAEIVKDLYKLINNSSRKIPLLLLHQINRKGREEARKVGRFLMDHLGEATQVENAADFVFAIYQSPDHEIAEQAEIQQLKGRRVKKVKGWETTWRPAIGDVRVRREVADD
jgi:replicative DNA helicase